MYEDGDIQHTAVKDQAIESARSLAALLAAYMTALCQGGLTRAEALNLTMQYQALSLTRMGQ